jgi:hypothetical protein
MPRAIRHSPDPVPESRYFMDCVLADRPGYPSVYDNEIQFTGTEVGTLAPAIFSIVPGYRCQGTRLRNVNERGLFNRLINTYQRTILHTGKSAYYERVVHVDGGTESSSIGR